METNGHFYGLTPSTGLGVFANANALTETTYGYDSASRLQTVSDGTNSATYAYVANSPLVGQITFQESGVLRMTTTKSYDHLNRLLAVDNRPSADLPMRFAYDYNDANQRTRVTLADGSYWVYSYDSLGQVTSGKKYGSENTPVAGQQFEYAFDDIGNRKQTKAGGDERGAGLRTANYSVNELNQYAQCSWSG